jgi:AbrB family looped-hinge helix DNA binding protein
MKLGEIIADKSGRFVLPKKIRELLRVRSGERLEIFLEGDKIVLQPLSVQPQLIREGRMLVFAGATPLPAQDFLDEDREDRIHGLLRSFEEK